MYLRDEFVYYSSNMWECIYYNYTIIDHNNIMLLY